MFSRRGTVKIMYFNYYLCPVMNLLILCKLVHKSNFEEPLCFEVKQDLRRPVLLLVLDHVLGLHRGQDSRVGLLNLIKVLVIKNFSSAYELPLNNYLPLPVHVGNAR